MSIGEFITPSAVLMLLHNAESEFYFINGSADYDDTRDIVDARLRVKDEFLENPDSEYLNHMDCADYMHKKTGLPVLLCLYYMFNFSDSAGSIVWPTDYDTEKAIKNKHCILDNPFSIAVSNAVLLSSIHPLKEWREFYRDVIEAAIEKEDKRRLKEARKLYDAINARNEE